MPYLLKANTPANETFRTIFSETDDFDFQNLYSDTPTYLTDKTQPLDMSVLPHLYINMVFTYLLSFSRISFSTSR